MDRRRLRTEAIEKTLPETLLPTPEPHFKQVDDVLVHEREIPTGVGAHPTQKTPLPHMPEVHGENAQADYHQMRPTEGMVELEFEEPPEFATPISVYVEESRDGDLMIKGFSTKVTSVPANTAAPAVILSGSSRERLYVVITNEDATNGIRIGSQQAMVNGDGWLIPKGVTTEPLPIQTEIWAQSTASAAVQVSILVVYEQVFMTGAKPHSRKRRNKGLFKQAEDEAQRLARRIEGWM